MNPPKPTPEPVRGVVRAFEGTAILSDGNGPRTPYLGFRTNVPKPPEKKKADEAK